MIEYKRFEVNPFGENTYIVTDTDTLDTAVIDPGMSTYQEQQQIVNYIDSHNLKLTMILLTHIHIDHVFGVDFLRDKYGAKTYAAKEDEFLGERIEAQAQMFHLPIEVKPPVIDCFINEKTELCLGDRKIEILHVPGHSPGSLLYYFPEASILFSGDVLFKNSIGRTDLPGGNHGQLIAGINGKLTTLPLSTVVLPGHGPATTIGEEMRYNPFF